MTWQAKPAQDYQYYGRIKSLKAHKCTAPDIPHLSMSNSFSIHHPPQVKNAQGILHLFSCRIGCSILPVFRDLLRQIYGRTRSLTHVKAFSLKVTQSFTGKKELPLLCHT